MDRALLDEATRRSGLVWVQAHRRAPEPVWHLWHEGAALVVLGGGEQRLDGVAPGDRVLVVVRSKERQADRLVQWWATVVEVVPGTAAWDALAPLLAARRLNAPDGRGQPARWAGRSIVLSLVPDGTEEPVAR